jgi:hypothetical protein
MPTSLNLFADDVTVVLTPDEWALLQRPVQGPGGAQGLLAELQAAQVAERRLALSVRQLDRTYHYAYAYGAGGFEDRFRAVVTAALRTGQWSPEGMRAKARRTTAGAFGKTR